MPDPGGDRSTSALFTSASPLSSAFFTPSEPTVSSSALAPALTTASARPNTHPAAPGLPLYQAGPFPPTSPPSSVESGNARVPVHTCRPSPHRPEALWISIAIAIAIICSSVAAIVETVPLFYRSQPRLWLIFETAVVFVFTIEFAVRCYAHSSTIRQFGRFLRSFFAIIDMLTIIPYYVGLFLFHGSSPDMQRLTVLRLFRLLRLFRCYPFSSILQLSIDALLLSLRKSTDALLALIVFMSFVMVAFSTMIYFAERGVWDPVKHVFVDVTGQPSQFDSIPASLWFVAEIITTVGLGDIYPKTVLGKAVVVPLMLFSLLMIALPSIVLGRNFAESWAQLKAASISHPLRPYISIAPTQTSLFSPPMPPPPPARSLPTPPAQEPLPQLSSLSLCHSNFYRNDQAAREAQHQHAVALGSGHAHAPEHVNAHGHGHRYRPPSSFDEHGNLPLGLLEELQRQNELLEQLLYVNSTKRAPSPSGSEGEAGQSSHPALQTR